MRLGEVIRARAVDIEEQFLAAIGDPRQRDALATGTGAQIAALAALLSAGTDGEPGHRAAAAETHVAPFAEVARARLAGGVAPHDVVCAFAALEHAIHVVCRDREGAWPPADEAARLRAVLREATALAVREICERDAVREHARETAALARLDGAGTFALDDDDPRARLTSLLEPVRDALGATAAALVLDADHGEARAWAWLGDGAAPSDEELAGAIALATAPAGVPVALDAERLSTCALARTLRAIGATHIVVDGIRVADVHSGAVVLGFARASVPPADLRLLATLCERAALWIETARAQDRLRAHVRLLESERGLRERFVDELAHDLRGPLTVALTSIGLIARRAEASPLRQLLDRAADSIRRADAMLRDLLDVSRVQAGHPLPLTLGDCDLAALVAQVIDELTVLYGQRFEVRVGTAVRGIWCARELRRAAWNLITNAVKHGAPDRPVQVRVGWRDAASAELTVHNEGPVIARDALDRIFDPFLRSGGRGGWGLGLPLVRACVDAHGGTIRVRSSIGEGTTFAIHLPRDSRPHYLALVRGAAFERAAQEQR
jgi:signal transduction histidine kinase